MNHYRFVLPAGFLAVLLSAPTVGGEVYKCRDRNGSLTFSDKPCGDNPEVVEIKSQPEISGKSRAARSPATPAPDIEEEGSADAVDPMDMERYYDPVIRTYAPAESIINETEYYLEFRDPLAAKAGIDTTRLEQEEGVKYLYYTGAYPTCRAELDAYFARGEASDREIDKRGKEKECSAGQQLEQGFKWHCYADETKSEEKGCDVMACWTHYVCD